MMARMSVDCGATYEPVSSVCARLDHKHLYSVCVHAMDMRLVRECVMETGCPCSVDDFMELYCGRHEERYGKPLAVYCPA